MNAILSDTQIREYLAAGVLVIDPLDDPDAQIQPASVDLTLANDFGEFREIPGLAIDPRDKALIAALVDQVVVPERIPYTLRPGRLVLARTQERVVLPGQEALVVDQTAPGGLRALAPLVGRIEGRSSFGRLGVLVHCTAGYIDPGFDGTVTLEIVNLGPFPVYLYPGMRFCQLSLLPTERVERPYGAERGSKYQGQVATTASRGL